VRATAGGGCATQACDEDRDSPEPPPGLFQRAIGSAPSSPSEAARRATKDGCVFSLFGSGDGAKGQGVEFFNTSRTGRGGLYHSELYGSIHVVWPLRLLRLRIPDSYPILSRFQGPILQMIPTITRRNQIAFQLVNFLLRRACYESAVFSHEASSQEADKEACAALFIHGGHLTILPARGAT